MGKKWFKKVLLPISVPFGDFCWGEGRICGHFDNEGGHPSCSLGFFPLHSDGKGRVEKPTKCRDLKDVERRK